jgi:hypothetical protein
MIPGVFDPANGPGGKPSGAVDRGPNAYTCCRARKMAYTKDPSTCQPSDPLFHPGNLRRLSALHASHQLHTPACSPNAKKTRRVIDGATVNRATGAKFKIFGTAAILRNGAFVKARRPSCQARPLPSPPNPPQQKRMPQFKPQLLLP